jgi:hypothetical protein
MNVVYKQVIKAHKWLRGTESFGGTVLRGIYSIVSVVAFFAVCIAIVWVLLKVGSFIYREWMAKVFAGILVVLLFYLFGSISKIK